MSDCNFCTAYSGTWCKLKMEKLLVGSNGITHTMKSINEECPGFNEKPKPIKKVIKLETNPIKKIIKKPKKK